MDLYSLQGLLHPTPPFDFEKSLDYLRRFLPSKNEQFCIGQTLTKTISVNGHAMVSKISSSGTVERPALQYMLVSEYTISENTKFAALDQLSFFLSLYDNIQPFYRIGSTDPAFGPVIKKLYGYHHVKFPTPFENCSWAILSQGSPLADARRRKQLLIEALGPEIMANGVKLRAFPEPHQVCGVDSAFLADVIDHKRSAENLHAIARGFFGINEEFLRTAPYDEVRSWLARLQGITPAGADYILIRGLGRMERAPMKDNRLLEAAARIYGKNRVEQIMHIGAQYGPWQGYWAHYLHLAA